uniref:Receptor-interacting protein n=1 Tax=Noccaea caerulescens TaxID=107243 RepID=A0A1J3DU56_NOCCA
MNIATYYHHSNFVLNPHIDKTLVTTRQASTNNITFMTRTQGRRRRKMGMCLVRASANSAGAGEEYSGDQSKPERRSFLSLAEAGLVEISGLGAHEKFLCRLTISSLNLLRVISEQEGCSIEELNAGKICDWFLKDKLKREHNIESAVLQWDDPDFPF